MSRASELIVEIQNELNMLKKDYILHLSGALKLEPVQKREYLEKRLQILGSATKLKPSEVFLAENIIAQVQSNFRQWDKQLERKGKRIKKKLEISKSGEVKPEQAPKELSPKTGVVIRNAFEQREEVVRLYDDYIKVMLKSGSENHIGFGKFQTFIQSQAEKFQGRGANSVEFEIGEKSGKVVIKTKGV